MAHSIPRERDVEFDLESGGNTSEEDASNDLCVSDGESKSGFRWAWNGALTYDGSDKRESGVESCSNSAKPGGGVVVDDDNLELLVEKGFEHAQGQVPHVNGKHVKQKSKPPKPPLPPKGPSLDAGDQKYVKELAELALRKRARIKRMKAVKRMKANKSASSSLSSYTSLSAMVITVFFFLVIILHGIRSASSTAVGLIASLESAIPADEGLISVQYPKNFVTDEVRRKRRGRNFGDSSPVQLRVC